jgi:hypothetical protein
MSSLFLVDLFDTRELTKSIDESPLRDLRNVTPDQRSRNDRSDSRENLDRSTVLEYDTQHDVSPSLSDYGSFRTPETSVNYVNSSHWAAILDSITDLRNHITRDEEAYPMVLGTVRPPASFPKPKLLYSCGMYESSASILKSLPPRPTVDRLISRYFNIIDIAPGMLSPPLPLLFPNNTLIMMQTD